jgi:hypothetical protein
MIFSLKGSQTETPQRRGCHPSSGAWHGAEGDCFCSRGLHLVQTVCKHRGKRYSWWGKHAGGGDGYPDPTRLGPRLGCREKDKSPLGRAWEPSFLPTSPSCQVRPILVIQWEMNPPRHWAGLERKVNEQRESHCQF